MFEVYIYTLQKLVFLLDTKIYIIEASQKLIKTYIETSLSLSRHL